MKLAFISGAYRADTLDGVRENIEIARAVALEVWRMGYAVICPHSNTAFFDGALPDSVWLEGDLVMLRRCDTVFMLDSWSRSAGAQRELQEAIALGLEVYVQSGTGWRKVTGNVDCKPDNIVPFDAQGCGEQNKNV